VANICVPLLVGQRRGLALKQRCHDKDFEERGRERPEREEVRGMELRARRRAEKTEEREMLAKGFRLRDRMATTKRRQKSGEVYLLSNNSCQYRRVHRRRRGREGRRGEAARFSGWMLR
jgi:hypothetical protein